MRFIIYFHHQLFLTERHHLRFFLSLRLLLILISLFSESPSFSLPSLAHLFSLSLNFEQINQSFWLRIALLMVPKEESQVALINAIPHILSVCFVCWGRLGGKTVVESDLSQFLADWLLVASHGGEVGHVGFSLLVNESGNVQLFIHFALCKLHSLPSLKSLSRATQKLLRAKECRIEELRPYFEPLVSPLLKTLKLFESRNWLLIVLILFYLDSCIDHRQPIVEALTQINWWLFHLNGWRSLISCTMISFRLLLLLTLQKQGGC